VAIAVGRSRRMRGGRRGRCSSRGSSSAALEGEHELTDFNDFAFFGVNFGNFAFESRRNFNRRFIGHDFAKGLVIVDGVARLDFPLNEFALVNAFAQFRKLKLHVFSLR
jgi:hypothetical protein